MIKINKSELKEKFINLMELGLTNPEIADRLNEEYNATSENALTSMKVSALKDAVGLKGYKPKKKSLFELVDDDEDMSDELGDMTPRIYEMHHHVQDTASPVDHEQDAPTAVPPQNY